jgi:hypothetical protein
MATIEEELKMVKIAHSRLLNQHKQLEKNVLDLINNQKELNQYVQSQLIETSISLTEMRISIKEINYPQPIKVKNPFIIDNVYKEQISEIISIEEVDWKSERFINYEIKFKEREEIYTCFVSLRYKLLPNIIIKFTYDGNGKLKKLRILEK